MHFIDVANNQAVLPIDEQLVRDVIERALDAEDVAGSEISVALVDNETIRELNVRYLEHDYPTDVLSFLLECSVGAADYLAPRDAASGDAPERSRGRGKRIEGEIIVSAEMARDRAAEFGWRAVDELVLYLVHGALHLAGYDDTTEEEQAVMRSRERAILAQWNLAPRYDDAPPDGSGDDPAEFGATGRDVAGGGS